MNNTEVIIGHRVEAVLHGDDLGHVQLLCECGWECWQQRNVSDAFDAYEDHVGDEMRTYVAQQWERFKPEEVDGRWS